MPLQFRRNRIPAACGIWSRARARDERAGGRGARGESAAIAGAKEDPAAVERGAKLYAANCAGCHGNTARGNPGAPDLIRSIVVLTDEKGILIAPVLRNGRPDQGMPKPNLTEPQIADLVAWLHVQTYAAGHRTTYAFQDVVTGDAEKGEAYFNGAGGCNKCHSPTGDLRASAARSIRWRCNSAGSALAAAAAAAVAADAAIRRRA